MREGRFPVNERKHTHGLVLFGKERQWILERRNKGEINLGVIVIGTS
jgi:hypothetical protein